MDDILFYSVSSDFLFKHKLANGELKDVEVHSTPVTINGKKTLFSVIHDISDRVKNEALVKEYTNKLQRVNSDLESFAYVASHDLKAPLNVVTGFLGLINNKKEALSNETRAEYLKYIQDAVDQMKLLINDLLQFSRIGSNKESLVEVDINLLLVSIQNILAETILQNNATIIIQPLPIILANKTLLNELLMNLLGNALKYHKRGQKLQIEIGYKDVGDKYQFFVKDNGIGIATENLEKVFVMFKRLHASSEFQGTGIGLSLCKRIVEAHGGEIWIESILGEGSTIYFTIKK
jgi:light-regulated signal transduction histidine kinase (bacteriophytochrome)